MSSAGRRRGDRGPEFLVSCFFCGTGGSISEETTQVGVFAKQCAGVDITPPQPLPSRVVGQSFKIYFDGCGVTDGLLGIIFAKGLQTQCGVVVERLRALLKLAHDEQSTKRPVRLVLNCLGLSRGGMACMLLAQRLATWEHLEMNCCLFDPVPGNLILSSSYIDLLGVSLTNQCLCVSGVSLANQCLDLRPCKSLQRVLALYPYEPLPDMALHAPILPEYPSTAQVEVDVTLGCHQGAFFEPRYGLACELSFLRVLGFLSECGTEFKREGKVATCSKQINETETLHKLDRLAKETFRHPVVRSCHAFRSGATIRRGKMGVFLNRYHEQLHTRLRGTRQPLHTGYSRPVNSRSLSRSQSLIDNSKPVADNARSRGQSRVGNPSSTGAVAATPAAPSPATAVTNSIISSTKSSVPEVLAEEEGPQPLYLLYVHPHLDRCDTVIR